MNEMDLSRFWGGGFPFPFAPLPLPPPFLFAAKTALVRKTVKLRMVKSQRGMLDRELRLRDEMGKARHTMVCDKETAIH